MHCGQLRFFYLIPQALNIHAEKESFNCVDQLYTRSLVVNNSHSR